MYQRSSLLDLQGDSKLLLVNLRRVELTRLPNLSAARQEYAVAKLASSAHTNAKLQKRNKLVKYQDLGELGKASAVRAASLHGR